VPIVLKSGSLNLLESSGLVKACNGIALPLPLVCLNLITGSALSELLLIVIDYEPLWSSGQSFWLQIKRSRVRFPALPDFSE